MAKMHMKTCSMSLIMKELHIQTTASYHLKPLERLLLKRLRISNVDKLVEQPEFSHTVGESKLVQPL